MERNEPCQPLGWFTSKAPRHSRVQSITREVLRQQGMGSGKERRGSGLLVAVDVQSKYPYIWIKRYLPCKKACLCRSWKIGQEN